MNKALFKAEGLIACYLGFVSLDSAIKIAITDQKNTIEALKAQGFVSEFELKVLEILEKFIREG